MSKKNNVKALQSRIDILEDSNQRKDEDLVNRDKLIEAQKKQLARQKKQLKDVAKLCHSFDTHMEEARSTVKQVRKTLNLQGR